MIELEYLLYYIGYYIKTSVSADDVISGISIFAILTLVIYYKLKISKDENS